MTGAHYAFLEQLLGEARIQFFSSIGVSFCLALLTRLVRNLFYGLQIRRHRLGLRHVAPNVIFTSHSFGTRSTLRAVSITWWDTSCAVNELGILHWADGFKIGWPSTRKVCTSHRRFKLAFSRTSSAGHPAV